MADTRQLHEVVADQLGALVAAVRPRPGDPDYDTMRQEQDDAGRAEHDRERGR